MAEAWINSELTKVRRHIRDGLEAGDLKFTIFIKYMAPSTGKAVIESLNQLPEFERNFDIDVEIEWSKFKALKALKLKFSWKE